MRVTFALIVGLIIAACAGSAMFLVLSGDLGMLRIPGLLLSMPLIGAATTAPGWVIALMIFLPIVTHRAGRKPITAPMYYLLAVAAGCVAPLVSPLGVLLISSEDVSGVFPVLLACGGVCGLSFAMCWHVLVLKPLARRRGLYWD
ncbi:hypothetical protein MOP88_10400 [Sphingomonas sp. WKB10]|nr:hypothetical protein [Sphingomonas sp. WKB10]